MTIYIMYTFEFIPVDLPDLYILYTVYILYITRLYMYSTMSSTIHIYTNISHFMVRTCTSTRVLCYYLSLSPE